ncbi:B-cell receptor CD22-like [Symphorus nematophorus]
MAEALTFLFIGCLLQGALCGEFKVNMPQTIKALRGSCVTIPCSFDVPDTYESHLDDTCKAVWKNYPRTVVFDSRSPQVSTIKGEFTGNLTGKDCTTTLNQMQLEHSNQYFFRVECNNPLRWDFRNQKVEISVNDDPTTPTLSPSTLRVREGASVSLKCSAPAPCLSHPPTLTWTPRLGDSQETLQENQDKTKVKTSVLTFTASHLHHGQEISCTVVYKKQDGSTESSVRTSLTPDISCALCGEFKVNMPQTIKALRGSCVTIPCSFDVQDSFKKDLDDTYDPTTPTLSPSTLRVREGASVSLKCSAPAPCLSHPPTLTWTPRLGDSQETLQENQDKTKVKTSVLTFTASHLHHGQEISCTVVYKKQDGSTESSVRTSLTPDISYSPKQTTVSVSPSGPVPEDSIVTLTCSSSANPAVRSYTWYRADRGQEIVIGTRKVLNIKAVSDSPKQTTVSVSPSGPVPEDSIVILTCSSSANPAVRSYTWYRADRGQEIVIGTGQVLNIKASQVSGPFFCKAENDLGSERSNINQIDVQYSPKQTTVSVSPSGPVPEDSIVILTCSSSANPAVRSYTWYRADRGQEIVIGTGQVLNIKASQVSGPFFCKAENDLGSERSNINQIDVQYSPKHTTVSVSPSGPVPEDTDVTLTCNSTANPAVMNYTWYRADGGQETFLGTGQVLNIRASKVSRPFFCKAENVLGAGRSNITLIDVQFLPQILSSSNCTKAADKLNCACYTVGNPSPTLQWYLDGLPVNHSDKFAISSDSLNNTDLATLTVFITTVAVLLVLEPDTTEEDIYVNSIVQSQAGVAPPPAISEPNSTNLPSPEPDNAEGASRSSGKKSGEGCDVIYSSVKWKTKKRTEEDAVAMDQPGLSVLQQVRSWSINVPRTVTAVTGSCVVVPCQTQHHSRVIWYQYHSVKYIVVNDELHPNTVVDQFRGRTSVLGKAAEGNCTLKINNVTTADNIKIYVWINPDSKATQRFYDQTVTIFVVKNVPKISIQKKILDGEIFQANCSISHSCPLSPPSLHWNPRSLLENFTLRAFNKPVNVTLKLPEAPVMEGGSIIMECAATCNPQPHTYLWLKRQLGQTTKTKSTERKMPLNDITRDTSLSCIAHNDIGAGQSAWLDLDVQHAPVILPESSCHLTGEVLKCVCKAVAFPNASLHWTIDGDDTLPSSFSFVSTNKKNLVSGVMSGPAQNQSKISCTATNSLGSNTKELSITRYSTRHTIKPKPIQTRA